MLRVVDGNLVDLPQVGYLYATLSVVPSSNNTCRISKAQSGASVSYHGLPFSSLTSVQFVLQISSFSITWYNAEWDKRAPFV